MHFGLGWKARNNISAEGYLWAQAHGVLGKANGVIAQVAALHAFQDEIVAMLQRKVKMRHQPWLCCDSLHQSGIHFDGINRADPEPW